MRGVFHFSVFTLVIFVLLSSPGYAITFEQPEVGISFVREDYKLETNVNSADVTLNFFPALTLSGEIVWFRKSLDRETIEEIWYNASENDWGHDPNQLPANKHRLRAFENSAWSTGLRVQMGQPSLDEADGASIPETDVTYLAVDAELLRYRTKLNFPNSEAEWEFFTGYYLIRLDVDDDDPPVPMTSNTYHAIQLGARMHLPLRGSLGKWHTEFHLKSFPRIILKESPQKSGSTTTGWGAEAGLGLSYYFYKQLKGHLVYSFRFINIAPEGTPTRSGIPSGTKVDSITDLFHTITIGVNYAFF